MNKIKPVKIYLISAVMFFFMFIGLYFSVSGYVNYILKSDIISFSFTLGLIVFFSPLLSWFLYLAIALAYTKGKLKTNKRLNKKITNSLTAIAIFGFVFSFIFSFYVEYDLTSRGYVKCHKKSIHAPTKYIISKDMCE